MVSVILEQMKERQNRIGLVEKTLKRNKKIDLKDFILELCNVFNCSQRKASEYIRIAKWRIENETN